MSLDLGELVGYLEIDKTRWNRGLDDALGDVDKFGDRAKPRAEAAGRKAGDAFGAGLVPEAEQAGEDAGEAAGDGLAATGAVAAAGAAGIFSMAFVQALDVGAGTDKLAAQLGATAGESRQYGRIAGNLYSGAWGDSMDEVRNAIGAVDTSIADLESVGGKRLQRLTGRALDFATAFEIDVTRAAQVAGVMIDSKLAKNGIRAFDLLTKGAQEVPAALREDMLDAVEEYGQFFSTLGYTGPQAFALLVDASAKGMYGIDKAGDAIKEFTILSTDMSTASKDAYAAIGLDAETMADKILKGGDTAQQATQQIIDGLLGIESPSARAAAAIGLFGTPVEDLNVKDIPAFLRSLKGTSDAMDGVEGASKRMADTLNDNASVKLTAFKRKLETQFVGYFVDEVIPVLEDDVIPLVERFGDWLSGEGGDGLKDFAADMKPVLEGVKDLAGFLNDMPGEAKLAALGAILGGGAALKVRGGGNGLAGSLGSALGLAKPIPVFVTNPGGIGGDLDGGGKAAGKWATLGKTFGAAAGIAILAASVKNVDTMLDDAVARHPDAKPDDFYMDPNGYVNADSDWDKAKAGAQARENLDLLTAKAKGFKDALDLVGSTKIDPSLTVPGLPKAHRSLQAFLALEIQAGRPITPYVVLNGFDRAMSQIDTLRANIHTIPGAGLDGGVPFLSGGARPGGVTFTGPINVKANSPREFARETDKRTRTKSRGGR